MILVITNYNGQSDFERLAIAPSVIMEYKIVQQWSYDVFNKTIIRNYAKVEPFTLVVDLRALETPPSQLELNSSMSLNNSMQIIIVGQCSLEESDKIKILCADIMQENILKLQMLLATSANKQQNEVLQSIPKVDDDLSNKLDQQGFTNQAYEPCYFMKSYGIKIGYLFGGSDELREKWKNDITSYLESECHAKVLWSNDDSSTAYGPYHFQFYNIEKEKEEDCQAFFYLGQEEAYDPEAMGELTSGSGEGIHTFFSISESNFTLDLEKIPQIFYDQLYQGKIISE